MLLAKTTRIKAAYADVAQAIRFLKDLGFEKPVVKQEADDRISFRYEMFNQVGLDSVLGKHEDYQGNMRWKFGDNGLIVVKPRSNLVVLRNSKRAGTVKTVEPKSAVDRDLPFTQKTVKVPVSKEPFVKPAGSLRLPKKYLERINNPQAPVTPTTIKPTVQEGPLHIPGLPPKPEFKPLQSPNLPGSHMNEDSGVPQIDVPERLHLEYAYAQQINAPAYRIKFMKNLWEFFNKDKFGGRMPKPRAIQLMRNTTNGHKLSVRGRWFPMQRILEMAPRTFNAHFDFFAEIFLHEMCHEAVTDINRERQGDEGGHGPAWQAWMRKVGLNPRRYDPNPNEVYMDRRELKDDPAALLRKKLRSYHGIPMQTGQQVTYVWKDKYTNQGKPIRNGRILGIKDGRWVMYDEDLPSLSHLRTTDINMFPYQGKKSTSETDPEFNRILDEWKKKPGFQEVDIPITIK